MLSFKFPDELAHLPSQYEGRAPTKGETVIIHDKSTGRTHQFRVARVAHYLRSDPRPGRLETDVFLEEIRVPALV